MTSSSGCPKKVWRNPDRAVRKVQAPGVAINEMQPNSTQGRAHAKLDQFRTRKDAKS